MVTGLSTAAVVGEVEERLRRLRGALDRERGDLELLNAHYEGTQPLAYMAPELIVELADRMKQVVIHWPELVVESVEERLDVEGFRLSGEDEADEDLWRMWQANGLDLFSHQGHVDALVMRRSYGIVGSRGEWDLDPSSGVSADVPLITIESPLEVYAVRDTRTRRVREAAKWRRSDPFKDDEDRATFYTPNMTVWLKKVYKRGSREPQWVLDEDDAPGMDQHDKGVCPVVPIVNRPRTWRKRNVLGEGKSDLDAVIPLSDAACKIATDMMVGAEFHALPRRAVFGAAPEDFQDEAGRPVSALSRIIGRVWAFENADVKAMQFPESSLGGFHDTMRMLAQLVASISGLPPHYLGTATDNPASADAIRSSEARLIKRAERKQRAFGEAWEQVMRVALLWRDGEVSPNAAQLETIWRDPSTPTVAMKADAAVKLFQAGVVPWAQTVEDLGYTMSSIDRMRDMRKAEANQAAAAFGAGPDPVMPAEAPTGPGDDGED